MILKQSKIPGGSLLVPCHLVSAQAQATRQTHNQASPSLHTHITTQSTLRGRPGACPWGAGGADGFLDLGLACLCSGSPRFRQSTSKLPLIFLHHNTVSTGTHLACCWSCEPPFGVPVPPPARGHLAQAIQSSPPIVIVICSTPPRSPAPSVHTPPFRKPCLRRLPKRRRTW